jgi:MFS superfamily sulfate permease-like transporter
LLSTLSCSSFLFSCSLCSFSTAFKEKEEAEIKKTKEREQKEKEEKEAKIKEVRIQEFLTYRAENPEVFENAKKGQEKHDRNKEELRIKKEWQLKKANEQNQIDKDDWSKPVDLNEYGISFKRVKYRKWKKALKKEKIRDQMFRRTSGDHHALSKEVNGVMKYLTVPVSSGADVIARYISDMNLAFGISRATLVDLFACWWLL